MPAASWPRFLRQLRHADPPRGWLEAAAEVPELRKRLFFSLGMLAIYRLGIYVTTPGVDRVAMHRVVSQGNLLGLLNFFSGGGLQTAARASALNARRDGGGLVRPPAPSRPRR